MVCVCVCVCLCMVVVRPHVCLYVNVKCRLQCNNKYSSVFSLAASIDQTRDCYPMHNHTHTHTTTHTHTHTHTHRRDRNTRNIHYTHIHRNPPTTGQPMGFHENLHYMNEMLHGQMKSCRYLKFFLEENNACGKRYTFYSYTFSI